MRNSVYWEMVFEALKRSICLLLSDNGQNFFSGVLVRDRTRYFIISANHCIDNVRDWRTLLVSTFGNQSRGNRVDLIKAEMLTRRNSDDISEFDIGVIEISKTCAYSLNGTWLDRSKISSEFAYMGATVVAIGFPSQLCDVSETGGTRRANPSPYLFVSQVADKLPELSSESVPINASADIILYYDGSNISLDGEPIMVHPAGMSGCGLFTIPAEGDGIIWDAGDIKLAGSQSSFVGHKYLRGKRSECILKLLDILGPI